MDVEDVLAFRVDDFYLSKVDTRVLVYYGITERNFFFMGIVDEESEEKPEYGSDLRTTEAPWSWEFKQHTIANIRYELYEIAKEKGYLEEEKSKEEHEKNKEKHQYVIIRAKKIVSVIKDRLIDVYESYFGFTHEQIRTLFKLERRIESSNSRYIEFFTVLKEMWSEEEFDFFLSDMEKLSPAHCRYASRKLGEYSEPDFDDYLFEVKNTPGFIKRCKYKLNIDERDMNVADLLGVIPRNRIQYFFIYMLKSSMHNERRMEQLLRKEPDEWSDEEKRNHSILKKMANLDLEAWHEFKDYMHIKGPYKLSELKHMLNTVFDGIMIYENSKDRTAIREIVKDNNIKFVEVKGSPRKIVQRAVFNHRQAVEVEKLRLLRQKNEPMPLPPVKLPEWIDTLRLKTKHDLIIAGMECNHCIGSYTHSNDVFVREGEVCAQIRRYDLSVAQCFDAYDQITKKSEEFRKRLEKALTPVAENYSLRGGTE